MTASSTSLLWSSLRHPCSPWQYRRGSPYCCTNGSPLPPDPSIRQETATPPQARTRPEFLRARVSEAGASPPRERTMAPPSRDRSRPSLVVQNPVIGYLSIRMARKSVTLVNVGPGRNRSPMPLKNPIVKSLSARNAAASWPTARAQLSVPGSTNAPAGSSLRPPPPSVPSVSAARP